MTSKCFFKYLLSAQIKFLQIQYDIQENPNEKECNLHALLQYVA